MSLATAANIPASPNSTANTAVAAALLHLISTPLKICNNKIFLRNVQTSNESNPRSKEREGEDKRGGVDGEQQEISSFLRMMTRRRGVEDKDEILGREAQGDDDDEEETRLRSQFQQRPRRARKSIHLIPKQMSMKMPRTTNSTKLTTPTTETQLRGQ